MELNCWGTEGKPRGSGQGTGRLLGGQGFSVVCEITQVMAGREPPEQAPRSHRKRPSHRR